MVAVTPNEELELVIAAVWLKREMVVVDGVPKIELAKVVSNTELVLVVPVATNGDSELVAATPNNEEPALIAEVDVEVAGVPNSEPALVEVEPNKPELVEPANKPGLE